MRRSATVAGCTVRQPKNPRKGHEHLLRIDLAQADSMDVTKYIVSTPPRASCQAWKVSDELLARVLSFVCVSTHHVVPRVLHKTELPLSQEVLNPGALNPPGGVSGLL